MLPKSVLGTESAWATALQLRFWRRSEFGSVPCNVSKGRFVQSRQSLAAAQPGTSGSTLHWPAIRVTLRRRGLISCLRDAPSGRILETIPRGAEWPPPEPARLLPPPPVCASRRPLLPGERLGGQGPGGVGAHLLGEVGRGSPCAWGPGKGWAAGVWSDHGLGHCGVGTGYRTHM